MINKTISGMTNEAISAMIHKTIPKKLRESRADHLAYALRYMLRNYVGPNNSYACECKHCEITLYTSTKRLNCEYCGSSDPEVFICKELK